MAIAWQRNCTAVLATASAHACLAFLLVNQLHSGLLSPTHANASSAEESSSATIAMVDVSAAPDPKVAKSADFALPAAPLDSRITSLDVSPPDLVIPETESAIAEPTRAQAASFGPVPFHCEVHVHQGAGGAVEAVDLGTCNGDGVGQQTLMRSLQRAAELVVPMKDESYPAVRTFSFDTSSVSPSEIAQQLSMPK